jgi:hypothetical protein
VYAWTFDVPAIEMLPEASVSAEVKAAYAVTAPVAAASERPRASV